MPEHPGRRRNKPGDPTDEPMSDPVPTGEDVVDRDEDGQDTPRRYDQPVEEDTRHIGNEVEAGQKR